ncbi:GWT1-domain-containing protein [Chlamydoabsidia padenii]|nr:GWT1-domain-containing protein [Chlamydoabsidia padenii]
MTIPLTYKEEKEAWVSNCTGGSILEVMLVSSSCVVSHCLWLALVKSRLVSPNGYIAQFMIYVVPAIMTQTIAADQNIQVLLGIVFLTLNIIYRMQQRGDRTVLRNRLDTGTGKQNGSTSSSVCPVSGSYKTYLTVYRAATMILTCIAILAVDFPVFPRRFAKVETFGTSLMDVGVGSFVFSSGVVASRMYSQPSRGRSFGETMYRAVRSSMQLIILGIVRLLLTRGVDYQLHSSEYGLHWNFFVTLGLLPPCVALITSLKKNIPFSYLGCGIILGYQYLLCQQGLQIWILEAPRTDLISANKEGICSFLGYLAIFLFGLDLGSFLFATHCKQENIIMKLITRCALYWSCLAGWILLATFLSKTEELGVSRRLANLPYVMWVNALNMSLLTALIWAEQQLHVEKQTPPLLNDLNANGLATFLVANALTGLVNLTVKTLYASTLTSMTIICVYMILVTFFPWVLSRYRIRIKL